MSIASSSESARLPVPSTGSSDLHDLAAALQHAPGSVSELTPALDRPLYGTTLYIAQCQLDTRFGPFKAYIFQDVISKSYLLALAHGEIAGTEPLYTRIHSSCVTSETLRGCDCDCVQQLEGAFKVIAEKGNGILFYLMQEGRGVGYMAKARDRMLVQASLDRISTFQAYRCMGLKKDHRIYDNVSQICHLLGIKAGFIVLTNNPDKISALRHQGLEVIGSEALEFEPSPFNLAYLASKAESGHALSRPGLGAAKRAVPPEPVVPFKPHALPQAQRFIYAASYCLPVRPVDNEIALSEAQFSDLFERLAPGRYTSGSRPLILGYERLRDQRFLVKVDPVALAKLREESDGEDPVADLLTAPYWFRVHVYYDIVSSQEYVVLTYGKPELSDTPVIRLQSESLFNRFPLRSVDNRDKFEKSVKHIVRYGVGAVLLLYFDGRGAGFGAYATDAMLTDKHLAHSSDESYRKLGVSYDSRDYEASMLLLKHHVPNERIQMVMNSPSSLVKKNEYADALNAHRFDVVKWIFLDETSLLD
jgi:3,4-dihydroxy 2-butanone 4-phosphate synthase / GTP cyclohydrolase II